jgi:hypothetical protein
LVTNLREFMYIVTRNSSKLLANELIVMASLADEAANRLRQYERLVQYNGISH